MSCRQRPPPKPAFQFVPLPFSILDTSIKVWQFLSWPPSSHLSNLLECLFHCRGCSYRALLDHRKVV